MGKSNKKYIVNVSVRYIEMNFEFESITGACNFMDLFLDHFTVGSDGHADVRMMRVDEEEQKGEK